MIRENNQFDDKLQNNANHNFDESWDVLSAK